jgi:hypothetical protein
MKYWRINTDRNARNDVRDCDLWYEFGMAFAGDLAETKRRHDTVFLGLSPEDGVFMHHSGLGVVGYGIAKEKWDRQSYVETERRFYVREPYEYRITVNWDVAYDCRQNPLPIANRLPYAGTYSEVDPRKWDVPAVLNDLRKRASAESEPKNSNEQAFRNPPERQAVIYDATTDAVAKIPSCIGRKVSFKYPGNEGDKHGVLKDRAVIESTNEPGSVPYWDVVDLIEFKGEKEAEWIRIGYYRKPGPSLNWGSQTTITEPTSIWKKILVNAGREKKWFRDLLEDVLSELKKK